MRHACSVPLAKKKCKERHALEMYPIDFVLQKQHYIRVRMSQQKAVDVKADEFQFSNAMGIITMQSLPIW
jgi:hypothetical protein